MSNIIRTAEAPSAEGGSTCSVCGASIERDPKGESNRTWHHNDGDKHDHEAKPSGGDKEAAGNSTGGPNGFWCRYCGDYQSVRGSDDAKKMRAHMKKHTDAGDEIAPVENGFPKKRKASARTAAGPGWVCKSCGRRNDDDPDSDQCKNCGADRYLNPKDSARKVAIEPHPEYGEGVWTTPETKAEALGLDPNQDTNALTSQIMEILERHGYDSIDRELAFWYYSQVTGRDYEEFYQSWLNTDRTATRKEAKDSYDDWMNKVDAAVQAKAGLSVHDLADSPFTDWYEDGVSPSSAAGKAIRNDREGMRKGAPFADYKDFADCVSKNADKDDPNAYCGKIKHQVEDKKSSRTASDDLISRARSIAEQAGSASISRLSGTDLNALADMATSQDDDTVKWARTCASAAGSASVSRFSGTDLAKLIDMVKQARRRIDAQTRQAHAAEAFTTELARQAALVRHGGTAAKYRGDMDRSVAFSILLDVWPEFGSSADDGGKTITAFLDDWYNDPGTDMYAFGKKWVQGRTARKQAADDYKLECYGCGKKGTNETFGLGNKRQCPSCGSYEVHSPEAHENWKPKSKSKSSARHQAARVIRDSEWSFPFEGDGGRHKSMSVDVLGKGGGNMVLDLNYDYPNWTVTASPYGGLVASGQNGSPGAGMSAAEAAARAYVAGLTPEWYNAERDRVLAEYTGTRRAVRSLSDIATEIAKDWRSPHVAAVPSLDAMRSLDTMGDNYGAESAHSIVTSFLSRSSQWRGRVAQRVKAELRSMANTDVAEPDEHGTVVRDPRNPRGLYGGDRNILLQDRALELHDEDKREQLEMRQLEHGGARSDYAHHNEDADYMWYQEEGRFSGDEDPPEDDPYGDDDGGDWAHEGGMTMQPDPDGGISSRDAGPYIQEGWERLVDDGMSPEDATDRLHSLPGDDENTAGLHESGFLHDLLNFGNPDKWGEVHWEEGDSIEDAPTIEQWRKDHGRDAARTAMGQDDYDSLVAHFMGQHVTVRGGFDEGITGTVTGHRWRAPNPYGGGPGSYPVFEVTTDGGDVIGGISPDALEVS